MTPLEQAAVDALAHRWETQAVTSMEEHRARFLCAEELRAALLAAITRSEAEVRKEALEACAAFADGWAEHYSEDIFSPHGTSMDCKSAGHGRHVARGIAKDIRALIKEQP